MNVIPLRGLAALALVCLLVPRSGALVITQSQTYSFASPIPATGVAGGSWGIVQFDAFAAGNGTLSSATLSVALDGFATSREFNIYNFPSGHLPQIRVTGFTIAGANLPGELTVNTQGSITGDPVVLQPYSAFSLASPLLMNWSQTWTGNQLAIFAAPVPMRSEIRIGGNNNTGGDLKANGNVTVTLAYDYLPPGGAPASTPEAGGMLGIFAGAVGLLLGFHRRSLARPGR